MDKDEAAARSEYKQLADRLAEPGIYQSKDYPTLAKRQAKLQSIVDLFDERNKLKQQISSAGELADHQDPELSLMANNELSDLDKQLIRVNQHLSEILTPSDPNNERDVIIEIRAAAGGDEASLFAAELYRLYSRWAERHNYKLELISETPNVGGGFSEISFFVRGPDAYKFLKLEAGVHRVQRVPLTESQGRIHTSTVTVAVLPEAEESDVEINPSDLRIDVYRSSGHGGQSVNTTDSAVRITHLPTGIVVSNQDEKSQIKNKAKAMGILRSRLLQAQIEAEQAKLGEARRKLIGSGDRSEKIRTYNFPQDRITDHRISYSRSNIQGAMDGDIDDLIDALSSAEAELNKTNNDPI